MISRPEGESDDDDEFGKEKFQSKAIITKDGEQQRLFDAQAKLMPTLRL